MKYDDFLLSVVVPCFNDTDNIPVIVARQTITLAAYQNKIILKDDGSTDESKKIISDKIYRICCNCSLQLWQLQMQALAWATRD